MWKACLDRKITQPTPGCFRYPSRDARHGSEEATLDIHPGWSFNDSIPKHHFNAPTEDPKQELSIWVQSTHRSVRDVMLSLLSFETNFYGKILFPRALEFGTRLSLPGNWWLMTVPEGGSQTPDEVMIFQATSLGEGRLLPSLDPVVQLFLKCQEVPQYLSSVPFLDSAKNFKYILVV